MFPGPLGSSLIGQARERDIWSLDIRDIREHGIGRHHTVDDAPAGGGPGMVMRADVASTAIDAARAGEPERP
jgi:tRNA (guanine37-N1)-methyltransferase